MEYITVLHDVLFAFLTQTPRFARAGFPIERDIIAKGNGLSANKAAFEISMDGRGGPRGRGVATNSPGARLFRASGEIGDEIEKLITLLDQPVEAGAVEA